MALLTDGLLFAATLFAGTYCWVLARRVEALKDLDKGLGGAIVRMTRQIELARTTLDEARAAARESRQDLGQLSTRAETAASQLRLLLATVQDPAKGAPAPRPAPRDEAVRAERVSAPKPVPRPAVPAKAAPDTTQGQGPSAPRTEPRPAALTRPRAQPAEPRMESRGEDEILDALRALAGGRGD